ncbi:hypothetical protein [Mesorhizobium sp. SP-1A]|uniref:hypothetical protein n=1 Tax=Mesorhizobium sp. SP-1A TaxID=3077840 RepID=UPI0028F70308|nr:hypothetical protein [Mesorhizobium sp. SP-1A]
MPSNDKKNALQALVDEARKTGAAVAEPKPSSNLPNEYHVYDPNYGGNNIVASYPSLLAAVALAQETLEEYRKDARQDGEWPVEVEDIKVIRARFPSECEDAGVVYAKATAVTKIGEDDEGTEYVIALTDNAAVAALHSNNTELTKAQLILAGVDEDKAGKVAEALTQQGIGYVADALAPLESANLELRRKLFPFADDNSISGISWDGFNLIGNKESIKEFTRLQNRALQLDVFIHAWEEKVAVAEARAAKAEAGNEFSFSTDLTTEVWRWTDGGGYNADYRYSKVDPREDDDECEMQGASSVGSVKEFVSRENAQAALAAKDVVIAALRAEIERWKEISDTDNVDLVAEVKTLTEKLANSENAKEAVQTKFYDFANGIGSLLANAAKDGSTPANATEPLFNDWFVGLEAGHQKVLREDKWMLADNAYRAGIAEGKRIAVRRENTDQSGN